MGPNGAGPMGGDTDEFAVGRRVFAQNCTRCHAMSGAACWMAGGAPGAGSGAGLGPRGPGGGAGGGPGGMMRGPDLSTVGKDPAHTVDWFTKLVRNPKSVRANARMPAVDATRISQADLKALAEFLASLK